MSAPAETSSESESRLPTVPIAASLFLVFLVLRLLMAHWTYFWEQDDISIAAGVAAIVRGEPAGLYRYGPQFGYYRVVVALDRMLGGDVTLVPHVMIVLSAVAGAVVPVLGLFAFRRELSWRARLFLTFVLFANPVVWSSSQYGNSGMLASAAAAASVVALSNRPGRISELAALLLFAASVLIRADSVLVAPVVFLLLRRSHASTGAAAARLGAVVAAIGVVYLAAMRLDPNMDDIVTTAGVHLFNDEFRTIFWEMLLWSASPLVLALAVWGWRDLFERRDALLAPVTLWTIPVVAFYFGSTTTPRYSLLTVVPVSICAVTGALRLHESLRARPLRRWMAAAVVGVLSFVHVFVGLGQFRPGKPGNVFTDGVLYTPAGLLYTGGFLWHGLATMGETLGRPGFGAGHRYAEAVDAWLASPGPPRRIVYVSDGHPAVAFRFHAMVRGAHITERMPGADDRLPTTYDASGVRVTWIDDRPGVMDLVTAFDLGPGDELWNMQPRPRQNALDRLPRGFTLEPIDGPGGGIHAYRLVPATR